MSCIFVRLETFQTTLVMSVYYRNKLSCLFISKFKLLRDLK